MPGPLADAPPQVLVHLAAALLAVALAVAICWRRKGTAAHRAMGRAWVGLMAVAALTALLISEGTAVIGPFGWIHVLIPVTLYGLWQGVTAIRRGDVATHAQAMRGLIVLALLGAGAFTLAPGRRLNVLVLGPDAGWGLSLLLVGPILALAGWLAWRWRIWGGAAAARAALPEGFR